MFHFGKKILTFALPQWLMAVPAFAALSLEVQVGTLLDSSSNPVSDGSIWAIIIDDGDGILPGGLSVSSSTTLGAANAAQAYDHFAGKTIEADAMINGDQILQVFFVDGENTSGVPALSTQTLVFLDAEWQAMSGKQWAIYWFPGITPPPLPPPTPENPNPILSVILPTGEFEIGGIRQITANSGGNVGMVIPNFVEDVSAALTAAFLDNTEDMGGDLDVSRFVAISVIPEPSAMVLVLLGSALLLRRRRA